LSAGTAGKDGKAVLAHDASHRLHGDVGVAAQVRHVAVIMLIGVDDAAVKSCGGQGLPDSLLTTLEFLQTHPQILVNLGRPGQDIGYDVCLLLILNMGETSLESDIQIAGIY